MNDFNEFNTSFDNDSFDLKKEISYYLFFWPWFLLTIVMALIGSYTYLRYTPNIYSSLAQVHITQSDASSSFLTTEVTSLFGTRVNVENDISVITSNHILNKVVKKLNLQTSVTRVGRVKSSLQFGKDIPFDIHFKDSIKSQQWKLSFLDDIISISNGVINYELNKKELIDNDDFCLTIKDSTQTNNAQFVIKRYPLNYATASLKKRLSAEAASDRGEIINFKLSGTNINRNNAILNTLIQITIEDRIDDQRQLSRATINFIDERLKSLQNTIDSISKRTIEYQLNNNIFDAQLQTSNILSNIVKENDAAFNLKIQLEVATSLLKKLETQKFNEILPANIGIVDLRINELLNTYNDLVMKRNNLLVSASNKSPIVLQIDEELNRLKKANIQGVSRYIENLKVSLSSYEKINSESLGIVSSLPRKEYTMRTLARQFKFSEDLLVFLSQRKEEASISYVSVLPNLKVLSYGCCKWFPNITQKKILFTLGGLIYGSY